MLRLSLIYQIPRPQLETMLSRGHVLELMEYDARFGLPDKQERRLPPPPFRRRTREAPDPQSIYRAMKARKR